MDELAELKEALEINDIVFAAGVLKDWHPITLSNLLLAVHAAKIVHSPTERHHLYENAVLALAWNEINLPCLDRPHPESALAVIMMAVDFNRDGE